jgi:hypothetical protein
MMTPPPNHTGPRHLSAQRLLFSDDADAAGNIRTGQNHVLTEETASHKFLRCS